MTWTFPTKCNNILHTRAGPPSSSYIYIFLHPQFPPPSTSPHPHPVAGQKIIIILFTKLLSAGDNNNSGSADKPGLMARGRRDGDGDENIFSRDRWKILFQTQSDNSHRIVRLIYIMRCKVTETIRYNVTAVRQQRQQ